MLLRSLAGACFSQGVILLEEGSPGTAFALLALAARLAPQNPLHLYQVAKAASLLGERELLAELRGSLRERMRASPLMDEERFTRDLEHAYRQMWRKWCGEIPPA